MKREKEMITYIICIWLSVIICIPVMTKLKGKTESIIYAVYAIFIALVATVGIISM